MTLLIASLLGLVFVGFFFGAEFVRVFVLVPVAEANWGRWPVRLAWILLYTVLSLGLAKHVRRHGQVALTRISPALLPWLAAVGVVQALETSHLFRAPLVFAARPPLVGLTALAGILVSYRAASAAWRWAKDRDWRVALGPLLAVLVVIWYGYAILYHDQPPGLNFWADPIVSFTLLLSVAPLVYARVRSRGRIDVVPALFTLTGLALANVLFLAYFWFAERQPWGTLEASPRPFAVGVGAAYAAALIILGALARWDPGDSWAMRPFRSSLGLAVMGGQGLYGLAHAFIGQTDPADASAAAQWVLAWGGGLGVPAPGFVLWFPLNLVVGYALATALGSPRFWGAARLDENRAVVASFFLLWVGFVAGLRDLLRYAMGF